MNLEEHGVKTYNGYSEQFDIQFQSIKEVMNNPSKYSRHSDRKFFRLSKGCKSKYRYVSDVITKDIWQFWNPGEQIFISAGTGRGKNTFIKKELLKYCSNQKVVIFENRQSLMQQQIIDIISEIDPETFKYNDISKENMVVFGPYKNIMIISYQCAALKCMLQDSRFLTFVHRQDIWCLMKHITYLMILCTIKV